MYLLLSSVGGYTRRGNGTAPNTNAIVRVRTSGAGYGTPSDIFA